MIKLIATAFASLAAIGSAKNDRNHREIKIQSAEIQWGSLMEQSKVANAFDNDMTSSLIVFWVNGTKPILNLKLPPGSAVHEVVIHTRFKLSVELGGTKCGEESTQHDVAKVQAVTHKFKCNAVGDMITLKTTASLFEIYNVKVLEELRCKNNAVWVDDECVHPLVPYVPIGAVFMKKEDCNKHGEVQNEEDRKFKVTADGKWYFFQVIDKTKTMELDCDTSSGFKDKGVFNFKLDDVKDKGLIGTKFEYEPTSGKKKQITLYHNICPDNHRWVKSTGKCKRKMGDLRNNKFVCAKDYFRGADKTPLDSSMKIFAKGVNFLRLGLGCSTLENPNAMVRMILPNGIEYKAQNTVDANQYGDSKDFQKIIFKSLDGMEKFELTAKVQTKPTPVLSKRGECPKKL